MIIREIPEIGRVAAQPLVGSVTTVIHRDYWSVTVETTGLDPAGRQRTLRISISTEELAMMTGPTPTRGSAI